MFIHNLKLFFRNIKKYPGTFLINLIGLSAGLLSVLLIFLWVEDERKVDAFHENSPHLYQVLHNYNFPNGIDTWEITPAKLADALVAEIPEVVAASAQSATDESPEGLIMLGDKKIESKGLYVQESYFDLFSYPLKSKKDGDVLLPKNGILLSEKLALNLFDSPNQAIGATVQWANRDTTITFSVEGVYENPPPNSTVQFDFALNLDLLLEFDEHARKWNGDYVETFLVLQEETNIDRFNEKIAAFLQTKDPNRNKSSLFVQAYHQRYLHGTYQDGMQVGGRIIYVRLFSIIALFIILIACINFMNLSTANATIKMKEIGVQKALGIRRVDLIIQYLVESVWMALIAFVVALLGIIFVLPYFNEITGKNLQLAMNMQFLLPVIGIVIGTGLLAGSYPAFYLSGFSPIKVLKGIRENAFGEFWIRKGLVVFQFALSAIFIVGVLVVNQQMTYIQQKKLGYERDNVLSFQRKGSLEAKEAFISSLKKIPGVMDVGTMWNSILSGTINQGGYSWRGQESDKNFLFKSPIISYDLIESLGLEMLAGRSFSKDFGGENTNVIINKAAQDLMELKDPIGKSLDYGRSNSKRQIVGVVNNFHYGSIHNKVEPLIFRFTPNGDNVFVKINAGTTLRSINQIEETYKAFHPGYPFEFSFMDNDYQNLYQAESRVAILSKYFSGLAIIISCMGLLGLAAFTAERRQKEIGIRKALGQTAMQVSLLLTREFTFLVLIALGIGLPIGFILSRNWLSSFAYKIDLHSGYVLLAGLIIMAIAWLTVSSQSIRAARKNPIDALREE